jgi:hypothetical protein
MTEDFITGPGKDFVILAVTHAAARWFAFNRRTQEPFTSARFRKRYC